MPFEVVLSDDAAGYLSELYDYIAAPDAPAKAEHVLTRIDKAFAALAQFPKRGTFPRELLALGIREYREVFFKPYRIIYKLSGRTVYVLLIYRRPTRHADPPATPPHRTLNYGPAPSTSPTLTATPKRRQPAPQGPPPVPLRRFLRSL